MKLKLLAIPMTALIGMMLLAGCSVGRQASEIRQFVRCEFRIHSIDNIRLAGVLMGNKRSYSDMSIPELAQITSAIINGKLFLTFDANLQVRNPNESTAAMNRMEYIILIDGREMTRGWLDRRIEIQPFGGITNFPVNIQVDVLKVLSDKSGKAVTNFALNLSGDGGKPSRVALKLKPSIQIGSSYIEYPGYITVRQEFTAY